MWHADATTHGIAVVLARSRPLGKAHLAYEQGGPGDDPWCCLRPCRPAGPVPARRVGRRRCPRHARDPGLDPAAHGARAPSGPSCPGRPMPGTGVQARLSPARLDAPALRGHRGAQRRRRGRALFLHPHARAVPRDDRRARRHHGPGGPAAGGAGPGRRATRRPTCSTEMQALLGKAWDDELEPFRYAGDGAPVRWLHQVV